ncbi:MAG: hypothetical protein AAB691_03685 [Patescibacteria group bacterium]
MDIGTTGATTTDDVGVDEDFVAGLTDTEDVVEGITTEEVGLLIVVVAISTVLVSKAFVIEDGTPSITGTTASEIFAGVIKEDEDGKKESMVYAVIPKTPTPIKNPSFLIRGRYHFRSEETKKLAYEQIKNRLPAMPEHSDGGRAHSAWSVRLGITKL